MTMRGHIEADGGRPPETAVRPESAVDRAENVLGELVGDFGPNRVKLAGEWSPDTAMLCVKAYREQTRGFELCFHYRGKLWTANGDADPECRQAPLELVLGRLRGDASDETWEELFHTLKEWCGYQRALNGWLEDLLKNENAKLIVFDVTGFEFPWELFHHWPTDGRPGPAGWIGTMIPVTRWTSVPYRREKWEFAGVPWQAEGGLLMMEDAGLRLNGTGDAYGKYEVADREPTLVGLIRRLEMDDGPHFALLVIRCHGERTKYNRLMLNGVLLERLVENELRVLRRNSAVVLLNACGSGRPAEGEGGFWPPTRSFVEKFLSQGASGVIATTGEIGRDYSHVFGSDFVEKAGKDVLNPAEYLRDHRRAIAQHIGRPPGESGGPDAADYRTFFWSFMYVYFGHPDTTLHLSPKDA
ncbi:hypothetical protein [Actinomadura bangladeshensis]|uniref:CHAT domain-containing protein n=1 Tax=Actinomadura bangladeshensis TaxID=453573 RepID=A0A4R4NKH6_9ACTN|nr:hypothetical protein [Actinomadura bangladeshensis]TDC09881.1 hypothetical protein E1284_28845 [Actinomadura bangladeshensis]